MLIPTQEGPAFALGRNILDGAIVPENVNIISMDVTTTLTAGLSNLEAKIAEHTAQKGATSLSRGQRRAAQANARAFIANAISVLKPRLGSRPSAEWETAGMKPGRLAKPRKFADILLCLQALNTYFTANPAYESQAVGVTAAQAAALANELSDADAALNLALGRTRAAARTRATALADLAKGIRLAYNAVAVSLAPDADAWYTFGFRRPIDGRIPTVPSAPTVQQVGPGKVQITFEPAVRASRYRVFLRKPEDVQAWPVATVHEPNAVVEELPAGVRLQFTVTAANSVGESRPSEVTEITLI